MGLAAPRHLDEPAMLEDAEIEETVAAVESLARLFRDGLPAEVCLRIRTGHTRDEVEVTVPSVALRLLTQALERLAQGDAVTIVPVHAELTTQQSADLLNVSRPFLVKLLEEGKLPHRRVGNRRKIRFRDLLAYKRLDDRFRDQVAADLAREAQRLGLDY